MRSPRLDTFLICIGFGLALIPLLVLRDFTPMNELRYLSIADESLRNGTLWAFTNHGVPYADKPPLYMWCLMLCRLIAGKHVGWLLILIFSVLPAIGIVVMNRWSSTALSARWRGMASLMLLSTGLFATSAAILRMTC